ncbi:hypothetical protein IFO69_19855 [Echinicola sp. CAU 1574]|uniref:Uncharacterized protein n=1 Tax=Echinicola arenosa TaxID=2774144 RepID=A0ABR9AQF0_9BACT|nr:hypothetical protein [Echinicola arenosa]MBD8491018.1 hypothetical protein [Echinicola arenosa]
MNYDIRILGEDEDNGLLEFDRLNLLTKSTKDIATKALMYKLRGFSDINPDKNLKRALAMRLQSITGSGQDGTYLTIDCTNFSETIKGLQLEIFKPSEEVLHLTPMALVIHSFQTALNDESEDADLDKPLLKSLLSFKKNFISDNEIFYMANRGTIAEVRLTKGDFQKIGLLEDKIPEPNKVIVNGQLDEMKVSKGKLGLQTEQGFVNVFATDKTIVENIVSFMGKEVTISGMAHYKPNGQLSFVEIQEYSEPGTKDKFFSKKPTAMTAHQQILFQAKQTKKSSSLSALRSISGLLKDEITDEQFQEMLKEIHR